MNKRWADNRIPLMVEGLAWWKPCQLSIDRATARRLLRLLKRGGDPVRNARMKHGVFYLETHLSRRMITYLAIVCLPKDHPYFIGEPALSKSGKKIHWRPGGCGSGALGTRLRVQDVDLHDLCHHCFWAYSGMDLRTRFLSRLDRVQGSIPMRESVVRKVAPHPDWRRYTERITLRENSKGGTTIIMSIRDPLNDEPDPCYDDDPEGDLDWDMMD